MAKLNNPKHERFIRLLVQGATGEKAYHEVYPEDKHPAKNGAALMCNLKVKARYQEVKEIIDSQFAIQAGERRDLLRRMQYGEIPTKVIRKANGKVEAIFDRLAAAQLDARISGEMAPETMKVDIGPTLKLDFHIVGRKSHLPPVLEAEWKEINEPPPQIVNVINETEQQYAEIEFDPQAEGLEDLKEPIDTPDESNT